MKTIQINKNLVGIILLAVLLSSCMASKDFVSENFARVRATHQKIAILPFDVAFENPIKNKNDERVKNTFSKQEKEASLDAQQELFINVARQVQKGHYEIAFQDFTQTNKVLAKNGIKLEEIAQLNKQDIAKLLDVDAVIAGNLVVRVTLDTRMPQMSPNYRFNDGVETNVKLFDAANGEMLWATNLTQRPNNQMDTPHRLSSQLLAQVAKHLPYRTK